jgi:hypothetical protein
MNQQPKRTCAGCGTVRPTTELRTKKIFYRTRDHYTRKQVVATAILYFCKDKPCAGFHQMSMEG